MAKALIVVDVQNDFCEGGALGVQRGSEVARLISEDLLMDTSYDVVAFTKDWHIDPGDHWSEEPDFVDSWPKHCEAMTDGVNFHDNIIGGYDFVRHHLDVRARVFYKGQWEASYSGFDGKAVEESLDDYLKSLDVDSVDIVGIALDYCVKATALDAVKNGYDTTVLAKYTAPVHRDIESVLTVFADLQDAGVSVVED